MLKKLLKYDLKSIYKVLAVFYALAVFFAVLSYVLSISINSTVQNIIYQVCCGFATAMVANCIINSVMRSWVRFGNNMYKDESYLTHTLPVSKNSLFLSKVMAGSICTFASTALSAVCIVLCYCNNSAVKEVADAMLVSLSNSFNTSKAAVLTLLVFIIFLELVFIIITGYSGVILGHKSNKGKMAKSIIIGFEMYAGFNMITLAVIFAAGIFDNRIMNMFKTSDDVDVNAIKLCLIIAVIVYIVYIFIQYIIGSRALKKGVNID